MKVIFLDIDGVVNNSFTPDLEGENFTFVDDTLIERVKKIVDATAAKIVLSSTWRYGWHKINNSRNNYGWHENNTSENEFYFNALRNKFIEHNLDFYDRTYSEIKSRFREIMDYLNNNPDIENYVIIDDEPDMWKLQAHLVHTNEEIGITDADVAQAIKILGEK